MQSTVNFLAPDDCEYENMNDPTGLYNTLCIRNRQNNKVFQKLEGLKFQSVKEAQLRVLMQDTIDSSAYDLPPLTERNSQTLQ